MHKNRKGKPLTQFFKAFKQQQKWSLLIVEVNFWPKPEIKTGVWLISPRYIPARLISQVWPILHFDYGKLVHGQIVVATCLFIFFKQKLERAAIPSCKSKVKEAPPLGWMSRLL